MVAFPIPAIHRLILRGAVRYSICGTEYHVPSISSISYSLPHEKLFGFLNWIMKLAVSFITPSYTKDYSLVNVYDGLHSRGWTRDMRLPVNGNSWETILTSLRFFLHSSLKFPASTPFYDPLESLSVGSFLLDTTCHSPPCTILVHWLYPNATLLLRGLQLVGRP